MSESQRLEVRSQQIFNSSVKSNIGRHDMSRLLRLIDVNELSSTDVLLSHSQVFQRDFDSGPLSNKYTIVE